MADRLVHTILPGISPWSDLISHGFIDVRTGYLYKRMEQEETVERDKLNIYEIAKEAGVSAATVSRAINQPEKVKSEKRKKILEIVQKYDFKPNMLARGLRNARSGVIRRI